MSVFEVDVLLNHIIPKLQHNVFVLHVYLYKGTKIMDGWMDGLTHTSLNMLIIYFKNFVLSSVAVNVEPS